MLSAAIDEVSIDLAGHHLPDWSRAYIDLGSAVATYSDEPGKRLIVASALPTRAYAAVFIAVGFVLQRAVDEAGTDPYTHASELDKAAQRGPLHVNVIEGKKKVAGIFRGLVDQPSGKYLKIEMPNETKYLPIQFSLRVIPTGRGKYQGQRRDIPASGAGIVAGLLRRSDVTQYILTSRLECVMVGLRSVLSKEIETPTLFLDGQEGCLQDLLRVRVCLPDGDPYRTEIVSDRRGPCANDANPAIVIFDGASAYLKWRLNWKGVPWIVLLDRSEAQFDDAADQVNSDHLQRDSDAPSFKFSRVPAGVEMVAFELRRR